MDKIVKEILYNKTLSGKEKLKRLAELKNSVDESLGYLNGKWAFCPECQEYYRTESFFEEIEEKDKDIRVYDDPINSGGDIYELKHVKSTYVVCPKGHYKLIDERIVH